MAGKEDLEEVRETIQGLNAEAFFIETVKCKIELGQILNQGTFNLQHTDRKPAIAGLQAQSLLPDSHQAMLGSGKKAVRAVSLKSRPSSHKHDTNIRTVRLELPGYLDLER